MSTHFEWTEDLENRFQHLRLTRVNTSFIESVKSLPLEISNLYTPKFSETEKVKLLFSGFTPGKLNLKEQKKFFPLIKKLLEEKHFKLRDTYSIIKGGQSLIFNIRIDRYAGIELKIPRPEEIGWDENKVSTINPRCDKCKEEKEKSWEEESLILNRHTFFPSSKFTQNYFIKPYAIKVAFNAQKELDLLQEIKKANKKVNHVVMPAEFQHELEGNRYFMALDSVYGFTLKDYLKKGWSNLDSYNAAEQLLDGLLELRRAGIYHRDLHDRNILADDNKLVIIDLGTGTKNPDEIHPLNRNYGGNNDIISVAQLVYKVDTGHNLFNLEGDFSYEDLVKNKIKTEREKIYKTEDISKVFSKVENNISDKTVAKTINTMLDGDLWTQPNLDEVQNIKDKIKSF